MFASHTITIINFVPKHFLKIAEDFQTLKVGIQINQTNLFTFSSKQRSCRVKDCFLCIVKHLRYIFQVLC